MYSRIGGKTNVGALTTRFLLLTQPLRRNPHIVSCSYTYDLLKVGPINETVTKRKERPHWNRRCDWGKRMDIARNVGRLMLRLREDLLLDFTEAFGFFS
jgi:hypothetical protein